MLRRLFPVVTISEPQKMIKWRHYPVLRFSFNFTNVQLLPLFFSSPPSLSLFLSLFLSLSLSLSYFFFIYIKSPLLADLYKVKKNFELSFLYTEKPFVFTVELPFLTHIAGLTLEFFFSQMCCQNKPK